MERRGERIKGSIHRLLRDFCARCGTPLRVTGRQIETGDWYSNAEELTTRYWREEAFVNDLAGLLVWQIISNRG